MSSHSLDELRNQIDGIDDALHDLLKRRAELVDTIARAKGPGSALALRTGREAQVLRRLLARHEGRFPATALVRVWREIMGAFTFLQSPVRVVVCRPADQPGYWDLARDQFGGQIPFVAVETTPQVIAAVRGDPSTIGVVPAPVQDEPSPWWPRLTSGDPTTPNIIQRLPFVAMPNSRGRGLDAYVIARLEAEPSGEDRSLIAVETTTEISRGRILDAVRKAGFPAPSTALGADQGGQHADLFEVPSFVGDGDPRLDLTRAALGSDNVRVVSLGAYAVPPILR